MGFFPSSRLRRNCRWRWWGRALLVSAGVGIASYLIGSATVDQMSQRQMRTVASAAGASSSRPISTASRRTWSIPPRTESLVTTDARLRHQLGPVLHAQAGRTIRPQTLHRRLRRPTTPTPKGERQLLDVSTALKTRRITISPHSKVHPNFRRQTRGARLQRHVPVRYRRQPALLGAKERRFRDQLQRRRRHLCRQRAGPCLSRGDGAAEPGQVAFADLSKSMRRAAAAPRASWRRRCSMRAAS